MHRRTGTKKEKAGPPAPPCPGTHPGGTGLRSPQPPSCPLRCRLTMSQLRPQASTSNLHASPSLLSSPPSGKGSSAEDANSLGKSSSFSYTPYVSRSPRLMQQSDSLASFGTPPRDRSPSPYVPERDSLRDELMGVLMAFRACDPIDLTSKVC